MMDLKSVLSSAAVAGTMVVVVLTGNPALASKPSSPSTTPSITLTTANPAFGGTASFSVTDPLTKWVQEVSVTCSQNGQQVYLDVHAQNYATWTQFTLWSQTWANAGGGPASCVAKLYYYTWQGKTETGVVYEAQTSFVTS